jgi:hypothetical protein
LRKKKNQSLGTLLFSPPWSPFPPTMPKSGSLAAQFRPTSLPLNSGQRHCRSIPVTAAIAAPRHLWLLICTSVSHDSSQESPSPLSLIPHRFYCSNRAATSTSWPKSSRALSPMLKIYSERVGRQRKDRSGGVVHGPVYHEDDQATNGKGIVMATWAKLDFGGCSFFFWYADGASGAVSDIQRPARPSAWRPTIRKDG